MKKQEIKESLRGVATSILDAINSADLGHDVASLHPWLDENWPGDRAAPTHDYTWKVYAHPGSNDGWFVQVELQWKVQGAGFIAQPLVTVRVHDGFDRSLSIVKYITRWLYKEGHQ